MKKVLHMFYICKFYLIEILSWNYEQKLHYFYTSKELV